MAFASGKTVPFFVGVLATALGKGVKSSWPPIMSFCPSLTIHTERPSLVFHVLSAVFAFDTGAWFFLFLPSPGTHSSSSVASGAVLHLHAALQCDGRTEVRAGVVCY